MLLVEAPPAGGRRGGRSRRAADAGERVRQAGDALWFHYPEGAGTLEDHALADRPRARLARHGAQFNTVLKLKEMLEA